MKPIIVDIETIGAPWDSLDEPQREYLTKNDEDDEARDKTRDSLALWAPTARIVTIAMLNPLSDKGKVYFSAGDSVIDSFNEDNAEYVCVDEKTMLEKFWDDVQHYAPVITFNGRCFDGPMLMLRSAMLDVRPSLNLVPYRYDYKSHCDLLDQLTFYGATRKFNLDMYARAFGIRSPKKEGVTGDQVGTMYADGKYVDIARYCLRDVRATAELWKRWDYLLKF